MAHLHIIYLLKMVIFQFPMFFYQIVNQYTLGEQRNFWIISRIGNLGVDQQLPSSSSWDLNSLSELDLITTKSQIQQSPHVLPVFNIFFV